MFQLQRTLCDPFGSDLERLRRGRYGVIELRDGRLAAIHLRRWPRIVSALEIEWLGNRRHARTPGDRCLLYFNQPLWHSNYLALKYVVSNRDCTLATIHQAVRVLDEVARIKRSDAIVCDVWNLRVSDRLLTRWGWEPHCPRRWHRNYIKRFYGVYPARSAEAAAAVAPPENAGTLLPA